MATALAPAVLNRAPPPLPTRPVPQVITSLTSNYTGTGSTITNTMNGVQMRLVGNSVTYYNETATTATNQLIIPYVDGIIISAGTTYTTTSSGSYYGTPAMVVCTAFNKSEITALESEVLSNYPALTTQIAAVMHAGSMVTAEWLAYIAEEELLTMPDQELFPMVLRAADNVVMALNGFESTAHAVLRKKLQHDLHHPAPMWVVGGGAYLYQEQSMNWDGLAIEEERQVGEDHIRAMLTRQYFPLALRWRRDVGIYRRAKQWSLTAEGQRWVHEESQRRRQAALERELRLEAAERQQTQYIAANGVYQAAAREMSLRYQKKRELEARQKQEMAKSSIKKATKLFDRMDQTSKLRLFVANEEVVIDSEQSRVKIVIRSTGGPGWLFDRTQQGRSHTPYELMVLTKDDVFLMKLCVYFKDTPVLDQLLAISVLVDAGDEERLLTRGNWFGHHGNWTEEKTEYIANAYPELVKRCPAPVAYKAKPMVAMADTTTRGEVIEGNGTAIFTNYHNESQVRWDPFHGRVQQWIKTWMENTMASPRDLMIH